jgi:hypothetical protein
MILPSGPAPVEPEPESSAKPLNAKLKVRQAALVVAAILLSSASPAPAVGVGVAAEAVESGLRATPPLPPPSAFPVQLVLDDDTPEHSYGMSLGLGLGARQFLWFQRFTPAQSVSLEEIWVLFPAAGVPVGGAIDLAVYSDPDGDPANGATLLASFSEVVQVADGSTFSIYPVSPPVFFDGAGDLLLGVVPRFIVSGVTPANAPAALDTSAPQGRAWLAGWTADPPSPPLLTPSPDLVIVRLDAFLPPLPAIPGNWMIRGFGKPPEALGITTLDSLGLAVLTLVMAGVALLVLRARPCE